MLTILRNIFKKFVSIKNNLNRLTYSDSADQKFKEWANKKGYKIDKLEVSSTWKGGFVVVPKMSTCVKVILSDKSGNVSYAYLLTGRGFSYQEIQAKFVFKEDINFNE